MVVALPDMHKCEPKTEAMKRFRGTKGKQHDANLRGTKGKQHVANQSFGDQPISPYRLFMEGFMKSCKTRNLIEMDRIGFETWKNMSKKEKRPYVSQAEKLDSAYQEALTKEVNDMIKVNDEADSAMVGKFDKFYWIYEDSSESSEYSTVSSESSSDSSEYSSDISEHSSDSSEYSTQHI